jgi:hypothetical protein
LNNDDINVRQAAVEVLGKLDIVELAKQTAALLMRVDDKSVGRWQLWRFLES